MTPHDDPSRANRGDRARHARRAGHPGLGFQGTGTARGARPPPDLLPAGPRPDSPLEGGPAAQAQDTGVPRARGRPLPGSPDPHARGIPDRPDGRARAPPERGSDGGDRPRSRPRPHTPPAPPPPRP